MTSIYFVGPYHPIMCGIADYTNFIARQLPDRQWGMITFDPIQYGSPLTKDTCSLSNNIWYGIPGREGLSSRVIAEGLEYLGADMNDSVVWFQHENGIFPDDRKFIDTLKGIKVPKIVTFHTLHFQSDETPCGLRQSQRDFLEILLPVVDGITVFSHGVYLAVVTAFPQYRHKVYVLRHGIHLRPEIAALSRRQARNKLHEYLIYESNLDRKSKKALQVQKPLLDESVFLMGETGFLCSAKQSQFLYSVRDVFQHTFPKKKITAMRIGVARDEHQRRYKKRLQAIQNGKNKFLLETCLPEEMLGIAQRAFDLSFYWPRECSQSGMMAHALGVGAIIAGRDMEGSGETLKEAGALTNDSLGELMVKMEVLMVDPDFAAEVGENALKYATQFCWRKQALRHRDLAESMANSSVRPIQADTFAALVQDMLQGTILSSIV